jgi:hypothetical protein
MQPLAFQLLADSDNPGKPIFIAIVVAIWIIGSIVSSIRKAADAKRIQNEKAGLRATRQAMRLPAMRLPAVAQSHPKWQPPKAPIFKKAAKRLPPPLPKKAPAPREPEPIMMQVVESGPSPQPQQAPARAVPARTASAVSLHRWLTPKTLRQQFILTEVLLPPVALREQP